MEDEAQHSNQPNWWRKVRVHSDVDTTEWSEERRVGWVSERFVEKTGETGAILEGTVIDAETEEVIDGVEVSISGDTLEGSRTEISENGKYTFVVPYGTYSIELSHDAYSNREIGNVEVTEFETELTQELEILQLIVEVVGDGAGKIELEEGPYRAGELVELKAIPNTENDAFQYWTTNIGEAEDYFTNYESLTTNFRMPDQTAKVQARFNTQRPSGAEFDYDVSSFDVRMGGGYGVTEHYWDISELETGEKLNFYFHALGIPDNFRVSYGKWGDLDEVFDSGWVSASSNPSWYEDPLTYPGGVKYHYWHDNVVLSNELSNSGGLYAGIIEKEEGKDVVRIRVQGKDSGTWWYYKVNLMEEKEEVGDIQIINPSSDQSIRTDKIDDFEFEWDYSGSISSLDSFKIVIDAGEGVFYYKEDISIENTSFKQSRDGQFDITDNIEGELGVGDYTIHIEGIVNGEEKVLSEVFNFTIISHENQEEK